MQQLLYCISLFFALFLIHCEVNIFDWLHPDGKGSWETIYNDAKVELKNKNYSNAKEYFNNAIQKAENNKQKYLSYNGIATAQLYNDISIDIFFNAITGIQELVTGNTKPDDDVISILLLSNDEKINTDANIKYDITQKRALKLYNQLSENYDDIMINKTKLYNVNPISNSPVVNFYIAYILAIDNSIEQYEIATYYATLEILRLTFKVVDSDGDKVFNEDGTIIFNMPSKDYFYLTAFPSFQLEYNLPDIEELSNSFQLQQDKFKDITTKDVEYMTDSINEIFTVITKLGLDKETNDNFFNYLINRLDNIKNVIYLDIPDEDIPDWMDKIAIKPELLFGSILDKTNPNSLYSIILQFREKLDPTRLKQLQTTLILMQSSSKAMLEFKDKFNAMPEYYTFMENPMNFTEFRKELLNIDESQRTILLEGIKQILSICSAKYDKDIVTCLKNNNVLGFDMEYPVELPVNSIDVLNEIVIYLENPDNYIP